MNNILLLVLVVSNYVFAGFSQQNFLDTRIKRRNISVPVFSNDYCTSHGWNKFISGVPLSASWVKQPSGAEVAYVLSQNSLSIRTASTAISFGEIFTGSNFVNGLRDFRIDEDGDMYLYIPESKSSRLEIRSRNTLNATKSAFTFMGTISSFGILEDWLGGTKYKLLYITFIDGRICVIDLLNDPTGVRPIKMNPFSFGVVNGAYSDGKLNSNGEFQIFLYGGSEGISLSEVSFSCLSKKLSHVRTFDMSISGTPTGLTENSIPTISPISEIRQFWIGANERDWRLISRMKNGNFVSMDNEGRVIEFPIISSINGGFRNAQNIPTGDVRAISTCNNRKTWNLCSDLMLFENFSNSGEGIRRMAWVNDGYIYNVPISVFTKDVSKEANISKPILYIKNLSTWKNVKGLKIRLWHSRAEKPEQFVTADLYYSAIPGVTVQNGIDEHNGNLTFTDIIFPADFELDPGVATPQEGLQLGIHFKGYYPGIWDKTNDWSWINVESNYAQNPNATVYVLDDNGNYGAISGSLPPSDYISKPVIHSLNSVGSMENVAEWSYPYQLELSSIRTEGNWGIAVPFQNYQLLTSAPITLDADAQVNSLMFDAYIDTNSFNRYWQGYVSVSIDIGSLGTSTRYLTGFNLSKEMAKKFTSHHITLSEEIAREIKLHGSKSRIVFSINGPVNSPPIILDNLQIK